MASRCRWNAQLAQEIICTWGKSIIAPCSGECTVQKPYRLINLYRMVAAEIQNRLIRLFERDVSGRRAANFKDDTLDFDPHWRDHVGFQNMLSNPRLIVI